MKFGGTSMADDKAWKQVLQIVKSQTDQVVLVVSATSKTTNNLIEAANAALDGEIDTYKNLVDEISSRHKTILRDFLNVSDSSDKEILLKDGFDWIDTHIALLNRYLSGIYTLNEMTGRSLDTILSLGERLSSYLLSVCAKSVKFPAEFVDAREVIKTNSDFGAALPDMTSIKQSISKLDVILKNGKTPIIGGYFGSDEKGITTTLGRGGSDYTASLVGLALNAEKIEIWTDVSGMYTCDPRMISGAASIQHITFNEAAELAYFGAKVLHPATIQPAVEKNIPVVIRNTFEPSHPGTTITKHAEKTGLIRAIAFKKDITVITIHSSRMLLAHGFLARVFGIFEKHKISVDLVTTSEVSISMTVDHNVGLGLVTEELKQIGSVRILPKMALICLVGHDFLQTTGIASKVFTALDNIPVKLISQGSSDINLSVVVDQSNVEYSVKELHKVFFGG